MSDGHAYTETEVADVKSWNMDSAFDRLWSLTLNGGQTEANDFSMPM